MLKRILSAAACMIMVAAMLTLGVGASEERDTGSAIGIGVVTDLAHFVRVRQGPSTTTEIVAVLRGGQEVTILAEEDGFYQIVAEIEGEGEDSDEIVEGYIRMDFILRK